MRLSLVSHGQASLANHFLRDLDLERTHEVTELVVTENVPDTGLVLPNTMLVRRLYRTVASAREPRRPA